MALERCAPTAIVCRRVRILLEKDKLVCSTIAVWKWCSLISFADRVESPSTLFVQFRIQCDVTALTRIRQH